MKLCVSHYIHGSIPDVKFDPDSSLSFGDMMSQNFPRKKGTSHEIRLFTPFFFFPEDSVAFSKKGLVDQGRFWH